MAIDPKTATSRRGEDADQDGFSLSQLGVIGWLMVLTCAIIIAGGTMLAFLSWSFQAEGQRKSADEQGLVPVERDFAAGQPKAGDVLFRIAGSKIVGRELMPDLVASWMRARGYTGVSNKTNGRVTEVVGKKAGRSARVLIASGSAMGGFEALTQGRVEAVMSDRPILPAEADKLSALGNMTNANSEKVIALNASYVIVNRANQLNRIDTETLSRILAGEITQWTEIVQNGSGEISVKLEGIKADLAGSVVGQVLGDREIPDTITLLDTPEAVIDAVERDVRAIGVARAPAPGAKAIGVSERNARTVAPDDFSISTEAYPFAERVFVYVGSSGGDPQALDFASYAVSLAGQQIVARSSFTPLIPKPVKVLSPDNAPREYLSFAGRAERMNFDVRFFDGANEPDSRAEEDLRRFADFVNANKIDKRRIALLGFADNVGARATNLGLAQSRAETVGIHLERLGISPGIIRAFGDAMPVGANAEERGRIRNRRVEVWLCAPPSCPIIDLATQAAPATVSREIPPGVRLGPPRKIAEGELVPKG